MKIVAYVPNLMDQSRFASIDANVMFVKSAHELLDCKDADIVVADLSRSDALKILASLKRHSAPGFCKPCRQRSDNKGKGNRDRGISA